ncbi:MAG: MlaD family protein [Thermodesulfovibrionales bacterium]|nr:MCE family protein [Nitrospinota bacterium]MCG2709588.1 MlaD family protein [Thermodesulfovibrionales bacterium]
MKETDPRFMKLKGKVGLFFIIAVAGIIATVVSIGIERGIFTAKYRINFTVDKGTGFFEGMPVKLSGFKIGKIDSMSLDENAKVKVTLLISKKYSKWIRQDSKAMLTKEGFIGEGVVDISVGSTNKPVIWDGGVIQNEKARGLDEIAEEMRPVIGEIKDIITYINDPKGDIKQTIANLKTLSSGLNATKENADKLLKNADSNISGVSSDASKALKNIDKTVSSMNDKINPVIDKLNRTMDNAEKTTANLRDAVEKAAPKVPPLLNKGEDALSDTNEVVKSLKQIWPIRLFIEKPKDSLIHGDSYE